MAKKMIEVILIGGGGHARVVAELILLSGAKIKGYCDFKKTSLEYPYLGTDSIIAKQDPGKIWLALGVGSVHLPKLREQVFTYWKAKGYRFINLVHPQAVVSDGALLGEGIQVIAGAVINTGAQIGNNVIINTLSSVDHDSLVGDHSHIAPHVCLSAGVTVGSSCHIGAGAVIIQGVRIGCGSLVAAGAVVVKDVGDRQMVMGAPARRGKKKT